MTFALTTALWLTPAALGQPAPDGCNIDLIADGRETAADVGDVSVSYNGDGTWTVNFEAGAPWMILSTHVHAACDVADFVLNSKGAPKVGRFDHETIHEPAVGSVTIIVNDPGCCLAGAPTLFAAHADVIDPTDCQGKRCREETAWGAGTDFAGDNWATYFQCFCCHTGLCDDSVDCTVDTCDPNLGCNNAPDDSFCDDGNPCTDELCDSQNDCIITPDNSNSCDDGVFCNGPETCSAGSCVAESACPPQILECGFQECDEARDRCVIVPVDAQCDDNDPCTNQVCDNGTCVVASTQPDTDGDGTCDILDPDDDNDGVNDSRDNNPTDPSSCEDSDNDSCDDCSQTSASDFTTGPNNDPNNDGADDNSDGLCNAGETLDTDGDGLVAAGDPDDDNDGVNDEDDWAPNDPTRCQDADNDLCDDCAVGTDGFGPAPDNDPSNDGLDTDSDGICDFSDPDDDNDGARDTVEIAYAFAPTDRLSLPDCTGDLDGDGLGGVCDNCPNDPNIDQRDSNNNGVGDACETYSDVGDECVHGSDCQSGYCNLSICGECSYQSDTGCADDEWCDIFGDCQDKSANGAVCLSDRQCFGACALGFCADCSSDSDCNSGEWCDLFGTCHDKGETGDFCTADHQCESENCALTGAISGFGYCQSCSDTSPCPTGQYCTSVFFTCEDQVGLGTPCLESKACSSGYCNLVCRECRADLDGIGEGCDSDEVCDVVLETCTERFEDGHACSHDPECISGVCTDFFVCRGCAAHSDCAEDQFCNVFKQCAGKIGNNGICTENAVCTSGICSAGLCAACVSDSDCAVGEFCDFFGDCRAKLGNNSVCLKNSACSSDICSAGLCAECTADGNCTSSEFCDFWGDCQEKLAPNQACLKDSACLSGNCGAGFCLCNGNSDCASDEFCDVLQFCSPKVENNAVCTEHDACLTGFCSVGFCAECDTFDQNDGRCESTEFCDAFGDCQTKFGNSHACLADHECQSDICDLFICAECVADSDCLDTEHCNLLRQCVPDLANGEVCIANSECESDSCASAGPGVCVECNRHSICLETQFCSLVFTCEDKGSIGSACDGRDATCQSDFCSLCFVCSDGCGQTGLVECAADEFCDVCEICQTKFDAGHACLLSEECKSDSCHNFVCSDCDADGDCPSGKFCDALGVCRNKLGNNAVCTKNSACQSDICAAGLCAECTLDSHCPASEHCDFFGDCVADLGNNAVCTANGECQSGICSAGFCAECTLDSHCPSAEHCDVFGDCVADLSNGSICTANGECLSGQCVVGFCRQCNTFTQSGCSSTQFCDASGSCQDKFGNNHICGANRECQSGICSVGFCAECTSDSHCSSTEFCNGAGDCENKKGEGHICVENRVCLYGCGCGFLGGFCCGP